MRIIRILEIMACCLVGFCYNLWAQVVLPDNMVEADCATEVEAMDWGIVQGSSSQPLSHMYAQPYIGDIDNDGQSEIVTVGYSDQPRYASSIVIYGSNLQLKYNFNTPQMYVYGGYPVTIADVDRDGIAEIFVHSTDGHLRCYHHDGTLSWTSSATSGTERTPSLVVADVNGDSIPEIWSLEKVYNAVSGELLVNIPEIIGCSSLYMGNPGLAAMPVFADFDNDGILELAGGNKVYKLDITNNDGTSGNSATLWKTITSGGVGDGLTSVADIDLDGYLDVVVVQSGKMYVWKPYSGTGSNPELISSCPYSSSTAGSRALLTDVDNDGYPEILFTYYEKVTAYKYVPSMQSLQQMWQKNTSDLSGATTMTAFDFNQDGSVEIVYRDESDLRIIDGTTGNNKSSFACLAPTASEYPAIVDLDKDGQAEIIASSSTYDNNHDKHAKLLVFHSPANVRWAPARYVWNQHAYNVVNVNNDLTVPAYNFNPATAFTDPDGVVRRPFNNFLQQATTLDQYGRPFMTLANASVTDNVESSYSNGEISLSYQICNTGSQTLTAPFHVTYYVDTYLGPVLSTQTVSSSLPLGGCITVQTTFSGNELENYPEMENIVVAVNDNGTGVAQNGEQQTECDTTDNFLYIPPCPATRDTVTADICTGEPYHDENFEVDASETEQAGTKYYSRAFQTEECDSIIVLQLEVHPEYDLYFTETIPEGTSYDRHGIFLYESLLESGERIDTSIAYQSVYGCDSVIHVTVQVAAAEIALYLPNAITPSKSDGLNDGFFLPEKIQNQIADFEIMIFNRWGEMVFYSTDKNFCWHGDFKGKIYYNNVYQYVIHYSTPFGKKFTAKGTVTVL